MLSQIWVQILALSLNELYDLSKIFKLSVFQFPYLPNEGNNKPTVLVQALTTLIHIVYIEIEKCPELSLMYGNK